MQRNAEGEPPSVESLPTSCSGSPLPEHAVAGNKRQREDDFESLPSLDALKDFILRGEMVDLPLSLDLQDLTDFDVRDDDAHQARLRDLQAQTNDRTRRCRAALFVAPAFTNFEIFDDFSLLVRSGLRYLVSPTIEVHVYHPLARIERLRAPMPTVHIYLDNEDLFADGDGTLASLLGSM